MLRLFLYLAQLSIFCWITSFSQAVEQLSLNDAIKIAIKNNPQLLSSSKQIDVEKGRFWRGISPPPPSLGINYEYIPKGGSVGQFGERTFELSQSIDFPINIFLRGLRLSSNISIAEAEHSSISSSITMRVKTAYYEVIANQKKIELAKENLSIAEDFAAKAEIRYNVGEATNLERLTANVQRTQALNNLEIARNNLNISVGELNYALGRGKIDQSNTMILTDGLVYHPMTESLENLSDKALAINPQIRVATGRVSAASLDRKLAWSSILPNLNASYYRQSVDGNADFYGVSLGISVPLWFLFDQRGQIQEAAASLFVAESDLQSLKNFISVSVNNVFLELKNNERQIVLHRTDILPQAEEVYRIALASYEAGGITYLEFLQARQTLISARGEYIDELVRFYTSLAKLEYAVGALINQ